MLKKVSKNTVASQVINQLTELIRNGELKPGDRLPSERDMADQLGVSRPPLREALRVLEYTGVIETRYGDGIYVKSAEFPIDTGPMFSRLIDTYALQDMIEMRKIVETSSVRLAIERATSEEIDNLRSIHAHGMEKVGDMEAFIEYDFAFHCAIAESTHNTMLFNSVGTMRKLMNEFNHELLRSKTYRESVCRQHSAILASIEDRDAAKAIDAMSRHLDNVVNLSREVQKVESVELVKKGRAVLPAIAKRRRK